MAHNLIPWSPCYCDVCQLGHTKIIEAARRFWELKDKPAAANACDTDDGPCACGAWRDEADRLRAQLADAKAVIEAASVWCESVEQGFASEVRPDIARAMFLRSLREYNKKHGTDECSKVTAPR